MNTLEGQRYKSVASTQANDKWYGHVRRMKVEHIVRRMLDVDIPWKRRRERPNIRWKDVCRRDDIGGAERGQNNKQGRMAEEDHQLYRRPQMTGQAREEEEEHSLTLL